ncbi:F-box/FBD/LRR-repeat protein At1g13570-like isoform X2 [Panicum virgatum]|uniref:F-box/FBD/LRR-repeat protein At1g13570-like isoform X2 n=1 Tax=Panicum virgatum TaxID=38727 RepID=UPI0019D51947|nr:F-box/FBD/LRR-repeat protein At1g13570-like isoform X2 [Panicum virgatum]
MADSPPRRKPRLEAGAEGEAATGVAPDLLTPLPLEVLDKILSRLHIYDVVRTSVLSRAWRRRWETLPTVNLFGGPPVDADEVDALLLRRTAPLRTFRLVGNRSWYVDALNDWLLYLSRNGVETLLLWFPPVGFRLHSSLFSCRELTSLSLFSCRLPPTPAGFAGFPSLNRLQFDKVSIPEHGGKQLAGLIARSLSIEKVELKGVELIGDDPEAEDEWVIQAPSLRELTIASPFPYGGRVEELPRLQKGVLVGCNYAKFLMGMSHITELEFAGFDWWAEVDVLDRLPFLFENLRSLLITVDFTEMFAILSFFCLLRSAPILEELVYGWSTGSQVVNADDKFLNAQCVDGKSFASAIC